MRINADFSSKAVVRPADYRWVESPSPGVLRMMLDRIGGEVARATSLVRFAPDTTFSPHVHGGGEEFYVLEGEFGDEHRAYPPGTYVRNPIGTRHTPRIGSQGCTIFVKLHQFDPADDAQVIVDTRNAPFPLEYAPGVRAILLHRFGNERVLLLRCEADAALMREAQDGGREIFVLEGSFHDPDGEYPAGTWVRYPHGSAPDAIAGGSGALLYVKKGHLPRR